MIFIKIKVSLNASSLQYPKSVFITLVHFALGYELNNTTFALGNDLNYPSGLLHLLSATTIGLVSLGIVGLVCVNAQTAPTGHPACAADHHREGGWGGKGKQWDDRNVEIEVPGNGAQLQAGPEPNRVLQDVGIETLADVWGE